MAEEMIKVPETRDRNKPKDGSLRRKSTGRTSTSNSGEKILPHYLKASTGSCHDFCKYGRSHAFEAKGKRPMLKRITVTPDEGLDPIKSVTLTDKKKKPLVKPKSSLDPKTQVPITLRIVNQEASSCAKKIDVAAKTTIALKPKHMAVKLPSCPSNPSGGLTDRRNTDIKLGNNIGTSKIGKKKVVVLPTASLSSKPSFNRVASLNTRRYRTLKAASPLKNKNMVRKAEPTLPDSENVNEKTLHVIELKPENKSFVLDANGSHTSSTSTSSHSSSMSTSLPSSPSLSWHEEEEHIESEITIGKENDSISEYDETETETENENKMETFKEEYKGRARRAALVHPEDQDPARKLNFRRGKVVNLLSENNGPRRLKFRQGRVLGVNQNGKGDMRRRSFKRRESGDEDMNNTKAESEKVALRHQDFNGKKDAHGLFNNVIEETASKLVEARKSKVKALVGAFETVISLQESKLFSTNTI